VPVAKGELTGKVAVVTGATGNLGSACCRHLAEAGAAIVVSDLPRDAD
jgi:NAD(P)-dependent dehydrogenase (short-subunit alcohol dehydrogenase family)